MRSKRLRFRVFKEIADSIIAFCPPAVKRLRFRVFKEIADSIIAFCPPGLVPTYIILQLRIQSLRIGEQIRIRIYCILAFKCGRTVCDMSCVHISPELVECDNND